jgi:large subunit ribosomal protein L22
MGKLATPPKYTEKQAGATAKYLRIPPRKARLVLDAVRGKYATEALAILKFVPNFAAEAITDVIRSAMANAENSRPHDEESGRQLAPLIPDNLKLVRAWVDEGPRIKRLQPRAQGRAYRIVKRMCHITVILEEVEPKPRKARPQNASRRARTAAAAASVAAAPARPATVTKAPTPEAPIPAEPIVEEVATAPVEQTAPVEATAPAEETAAVETSTAVEEAPVAEASPETPAASDDTTDEIGAPVTTEADVKAEAGEASSDEDAAEAPKAE